MKAIYSRPTGFSDISCYKYECEILDFIAINQQPKAIIKMGNALSCVSIHELTLCEVEDEQE